MDKEKLNQCIYDIYVHCEITKFPIDCIKIIQAYGIKLQEYSSLSAKKRTACKKLSRDACLIGNVLYYEDKNIPERIRFSLMHEFGHYFMNTEEEDDADIFSSNILAPRIMIHAMHFRNADNIHDYFGLSYSASNLALADYKNWYRHISWTTRQHSEAEEKIKQIFIETPKKATPPKPEPQEAKAKPRKRKTKAEREVEERLAILEVLGLRYDNDYLVERARNQWLFGNDY